MGKQDRQDLTRRLESHRPASLLAIGPQAGALVSDYQRAHPECAIEHLDPHGTLDGRSLLDELTNQGRFDFVVLRGVLERLDEDSGAHLIARLRDIHTGRFCVILGGIDAGHRWTAAELSAMGLTHWSTERVNDAALEIYGFDLGTYKATPDWLNARHWAHPEHWGKFRW
jgi:hypothetical protein